MEIADNTNHTCPLCSGNGKTFYEFKLQRWYKCENCSGIFMDKKSHPDSSAEKIFYETHINDVDDKRYQKFVSPITSAILNNFDLKHKGLDFGAGTGPVISKILTDNSYSIKQYDPFFHYYPNLLKEKYDYIACCEVIEHFYNPKKEFELLRDLLLPNGKLFCMTDIYNDNIDFHKWYYKNDPTHVFIYQENSIKWIQKEIGFSDVIIDGRLITFVGR